jgi:LPS-assembly protein
MSKTTDKMWRATVGGLVLAATSFSTMTPDAWAQFAAPGAQINSKQPVTFQADRIDYDQKTNIVTLIGHVEAWQAGHVLFADRLLYDRNTNISDAIGHVVLISPDGQIVYSDYAELSRDMTNGIMSKMNVTLPLNAKLAANGARRTEGKLNELTRAVYTACDVCMKHPDSSPLWQIHAVMEIYGVPIFWLPYFSHPDPSAKRQSGLLTPSIGVNSHLGGFAEIPYYWVLDNQSDAIITPTLSTKDYAALDVKYRRDFNFGTLNLNPSAGLDQGRIQGALFANGLFDLNNTWRAGFNFQRASSVGYLNDYSILPDVNELESQLYIRAWSPAFRTASCQSCCLMANTPIPGSRTPGAAICLSARMPSTSCARPGPIPAARPSTPITRHRSRIRSAACGAPTSISTPLAIRRAISTTFPISRPRTVPIPPAPYRRWR